MKFSTNTVAFAAVAAVTLLPSTLAQYSAESITRQYEALRSAENIRMIKEAHADPRGNTGYFPQANELDMQVLQNLANAEAADIHIVQRKGPIKPPRKAQHEPEFEEPDIDFLNEEYEALLERRKYERSAENFGESAARQRIDFTKHLVSKKEKKDREASARERRQANDGDQLRMGIVRDADNSGVSSLYRKFNKGAEGHGEGNLHPYDKRVLEYFDFIKSQQHTANDGSVYDPVAPVRGVDKDGNVVNVNQVDQVVSPFANFRAYVGMDDNTNALEVALGVTWGLILLVLLLAVIVFLLRRWREKRPENYKSITNLSKSGVTTKRTTGYELTRDTEDSKATPNDGNGYY